MSAPQGLIEFAGVRDPLPGGTFTITHGITPSSATIYCAPQSGLVWKVGPLKISYGNVQLTFPDCTADRISVDRDTEGREIWIVHILDRRWKWRETGRISGYYNVKRDTDEVIKETEKDPQQLAKLCLEAMGEKRFDVTALPTLPRPEIEWDYDLPAEALAKLCDTFGCRVTLQLDNSVKIVKAGVGKELPIDALATEGSIEPDPPERPDSLVFVGGKTRWQIDFKLEPVGLDIDQRGDWVVRKLTDLSYTPRLALSGKKTWDYADIPTFECVYKPELRELAKQSVFKWYRIVPGFSLPGIDGKVEDLDRILPIESQQIEKMKVDGRIEPRPAWVFGLYTSDMDSIRDTDDTDKVDGNVLGKPKSLYTGSFDVDEKRGIVKFADPVYRHKQLSLTSAVIRPADLRLRTTVSVRDEDTRGWIRKEIERKLTGPKANTLPRYVTRDDIAEEHFQTFQGGSLKWFDNKAYLEKQAKYYLDSAEREYQFDSPSAVTYAGFRAINLDGAIQQVTWNIDGSGFARTRASRNREELLFTPSYKERRRMEQLKIALDKARKTEKQREDNQKKARA